MSHLSRWEQFPKTTFLACLLVVVPTILFALRPTWVFAQDEVFASVVLLFTTVLGVGLFIVLTYLIERRKKYALVPLVFGVFFLLFIATLLLAMLR